MPQRGERAQWLRSSSSSVFSEETKKQKRLRLFLRCFSLNGSTTEKLSLSAPAAAVEHLLNINSVSPEMD